MIETDLFLLYSGIFIESFYKCPPFPVWGFSKGSTYRVCADGFLTYLLLYVLCCLSIIFFNIDYT